MKLAWVMVFAGLVGGCAGSGRRPDGLEERLNGKVNIDLAIVEVPGAELGAESLPAAEVKARRAPIDRQKAGTLSRLVRTFKEEGDPLMNEVFAPLHGERKFSPRIVITSGVPAPYDAWTATYAGERAIFFNVDEWDEAEFDRFGMNVLKHEITHVLMEPLLKKPDPRNAHETLDWIVINEGIAHFIGHPQRLSLLKEKAEKWRPAELRLAEALQELDEDSVTPERRAQLLKLSQTGRYWGKFGAISGMFRAADVFYQRGAQGLSKAIQASRLD